MMSDESLDALCKHCGQTLTNFLHQMEEHNAEVVCPSCGKSQHNGAAQKADATPNLPAGSTPASRDPGKKRPKGKYQSRPPGKP